MYRPQFAFPEMSKCYPQRAHFSYDSSNCPFLASGNLAAGAHTGRIPLQLDQDAPFFLRAIQQEATGLQLRLETPYADPLSDSGNSSQPTNYVYAALYSETGGAGLVTLESDEWGIYCPRGGVLNLYVNNPTSAPINLNTVILSLHGVKAYEGAPCQ